MKKLKVFGISILLLLLLNLVSAQDLALEYPEQVNYGEEFEIIVELMDFEENTYDVKIDVIDGGSRIARILEDGEWHSTYNYIQDIIDTSKENEASFTLNITEEYVGTATIEVKIRDPSGKTEEFQGYEIEIMDGNAEVQEEENQELENKESEEEEESEVYIDMEWDDDNIINGEEFEIEISVFDLDSKTYDAKVYIIDEDEEIISEIFDEDDAEWNSGNYYLRDFFQGPGDQSETVTIRINEEYEDFEGEATIKTRLRITGTTPIIAEEQYEIEILEQENYEEEEKKIEEITYKKEEEDEKTSEVKKSSEIIKLNSNTIKQEEEEAEEEVKILYKSENEKMKEYSMYGLNLLLIGIIIFLLINFKNNKNKP